MKEIQLTQGMVALVDDGDYEELSKWKWYASKNKGKRTFYARRHLPAVGGRRGSITMHNAISGLKNADHIDCNGLNNQKHNLRAATNSQNMANQFKRRTHAQESPTSPFKGVSRRTYVYPFKTTIRWRAEITILGKRIRLGDFVNPEDAARAYDTKAREIFGEFAKTNF